jgi:type II secretory pathway component HofQ
MSLTRKDFSSTSETKAEKFSIKVEGVTVRQALSVIANQSRTRFWLFQTLDNGFFSISNSQM